MFALVIALVLNLGYKAVSTVTGVGKSSHIAGSMDVDGFPSESYSCLGAAATETLNTMTSLLSNGTTVDCPEGYGRGYADNHEGTGVSVYNQDGKLLVTSTLTGGTVSLSGLSFSFAAKVPKSDFYQIEVASRGKTNYSFSDLQNNSRKVSVGTG